MSLPFRLALPSDPRLRFALVAAAVLVLPALILGPWLPLLDLVGYVGMNSYPPKLSAGPLHFSVFQFTYIVHYALSRLLHDLGFSAGGQVLFIYLLQAAILFWVIQVVLRQFIAHVWVCSLAIGLGTLAFWDGHFLWGGPLAFSLAALVLAVAIVISLREVETPSATAHLTIPALMVFSMMCHPFAFPFALVLVFLRFLFVPRCRLQSVLLVAALAVFAWVIRNDSPENPDTPQLTTLFAFPLKTVFARCAELFYADARMTTYLFGATPFALRGYMILMGAIHLIGFICAPIVVITEKRQRALRMLAALNTIVALLYFCSAENLIVTQWPQRILTFYSPFTFAAGIVLPWLLLQRRWPGFAAGQLRIGRWAWALPAAMLGLMIAVQVPVLRLGQQIGNALAGFRDGVLKSGLHNTFVVFSNVDAIKPFYLRATPFLLFSDPALVSRNLIFFTEWHLQPRHPTRLIEQWFDLGRPQVEASFSLNDGRLNLNFNVLPPAVVPIGTGNNDASYGSKTYLGYRQISFGDHLLGLGATRDAILHYQAAARLLPDRADVQNNLGVALLRLGRAAEARECFAAAARTNPGFAEAHMNLGAVLIELGKLDDGIRAYEAGVRLKDNIPDWHLALGKALAKAGRPADAAARFEFALKLNPALQAARDELAKLQKR